MRIEITKGRSDDRITARRDDGSTVETRFPKKGPVPHDAVHYFVERELGLAEAFWGTVAAGHHPEDVAELAKAGGHASASRRREPDREIVQLLQAERLVECFEAELWGGGGDDAALLDVARAGWEASLVNAPAIAPGAITAIRTELAAFARDWIAAPEGHVATLDWD